MFKRELMHPEGGFYAALDADSEGEEGKFYVWNHEEVIDLLQNDATIFCDFLILKPNGNWEEKIFYREKKKKRSFVKEKNISLEELRRIVQKGKSILLEKR